MKLRTITKESHDETAGDFCPERPTCESCPHWQRQPDAFGLAGCGECRLNAPTRGVDPEYRWPSVNTMDWCGQHPKMAEFIKTAG